MNIIETVKKTLSQCPKIDDFCNGLHVDFSENKSGDFGLYSSGDALVGKDILGNEKRKHSLCCTPTADRLTSLTDWRTVLFYWS